MLECLILGDSIAVGIGQHRPDCQIIAKVGINSRDFIKAYSVPGSAPVTIISLGTNDGNIDTYGELMKLRRKLNGGRVYWVLPSASKKPIQRQMVQTLAYGWGDGTIDIPRNLLSGDGIHLTGNGYKLVAGNIK